MLGPLPMKYRIIVSACALAAFVGLGAWISYLLPDSFVAPLGAGLGLGIGAVAVLLLVTDFEPHRPTHRAARVRTPRHH